jgi:hypothetical protein
MLKFKILYLTDDENNQRKVKDAWGTTAGDEDVHKFTTFEKFQENKRVDKYDFVIGVTHAMTQDDIEMQEDFWRHYANAPVMAWVGTLDEESQAWIK